MRPALTSAERRARRATINGVLQTVNEEMAALDGPVLGSILPVLWEAERELSRDLATILERAGGEEMFTAQQYRNALVQIRGSLKGFEEMRPALESILGKGGDRAGKLATAHIERELNTFSLAFDGTISPIALDTAALLARGEKLLFKRYQTSAKRYTRMIRKDIQKQLAIGKVRGENFSQLAKRLVRLGGGPKGLVATQGIAGRPGALVESIAEGLFQRHTYFAERLARTEMVNAYNVQADLALEKAHSIDDRIMSRWDASYSRACPICGGLDSVAVGVGEAFPGGYFRPPDPHPNCRCALIAWRSDWSELGGVKTPS